MKKLLLSIALILTGCSNNSTKLAFQASDFDIMRTGDESGTVTTINQKLENEMLEFGLKELSKEEQKQVKKSYNEGKEKIKQLMNKKSGFIKPKAQLFPIAKIPEMNFIDEFLQKNPKAKGVHPDLILTGATVYKFFKDWMVFEGMRSKEKQEEYIKKGVSWTKNSRHLIGQAYDLLAKNKHGKYDFKELHRLGMVRGMFDYVHQQLKEAGKVCSEVEAVDLWKRVVDLYHWQINLLKGCKKILTYYVIDRRMAYSES